MNMTDFVDTPILGGAGPLVLAGGGMASLSSVVSACTRLVADQSIIGRALIIASKTTLEHAQQVGLESEIQVDGQDIWDCYAHDFEQTDLFSRKIVAVTNLIGNVRGWAGMGSDIWGNLSRKFWRSLGY